MSERKRYSHNEILALHHNPEVEKSLVYQNSEAAHDIPLIPLAKLPVSDLERKGLIDPQPPLKKNTPKQQQWKHHVESPPARFIPPSWLYKDPTGAVQGPFRAIEMHDWYCMQFFSDTLPIKRVSDLDYMPLRDLLKVHGFDRPFLADVEAREAAHMAAVNSSQTESKLPEPQQYPYENARLLYPQQAQRPAFAGGLGRGWGANVFGSPVAEPFKTKTPTYSPFKSPYGTPFANAYPNQQPQVASEVAASLFDTYTPPKQASQHSPAISPKDWPGQSLGLDGVIDSPQPTSPQEAWKDRSNWTPSEAVSPVGAPTSPNVVVAPTVQKVEKKKKKKPLKNAEEAASIEREEVERQAHVAAERRLSDSNSPVWNAPNGPKLSLKEIQAKEAQDALRKEMEKEKRAAELLRMEALSLQEQQQQASHNYKWAVKADRNTPSTLAEIMKQEADERSRIKEDALAAANKRYSEKVEPAGWTKVVNKPGPANGGWNLVGVKAKAAMPPVPAGPPQPRPTVVASRQAPARIVVDPVVSWCRQALSVISSPAFNSNMFIEMLMSIDHNSNSSMIHTICYDTLGGYTAIDSRKFALEFIKRRQASTDSEWQVVKEAASFKEPRGGSAGGGFESPNKFVVVGKKKKR